MNTESRIGKSRIGVLTALSAMALLTFTSAAMAAGDARDARRAMVPVLVTDMGPKLLSSPPGYPATPLRLGMQGAVQLRMMVGTDGVPRRLSVASSSGYRALDQAALRTAGSWRFRPAQVDGAPVETWASIPVSFKLEAPRGGAALIVGN